MEQNRPFTSGNGSPGNVSGEGNPPWKKEKKLFSFSEFVEKRWKLIIGICVLLIVIALIFMPENSADKKAAEESQKSLEGTISVLSSRLDKVESRISGLEHAMVASDQNAIKERLGQFESSVTQKVEELNKRVEDLHKALSSSEGRKPEHTRTIETETAKQPTVSQKKPVELKKLSPDKAHIHQVEKGETIFSIARKYKVKVEDIYKANNMTAASIIQPGQKLTIYPPKDN